MAGELSTMLQILATKARNGDLSDDPEYSQQVSQLLEDAARAIDGGAAEAGASFRSGASAAVDCVVHSQPPSDDRPLDMAHTTAAAYLLDRADQIAGCCAVTAANLARAIAKGEHVNAWAHGELDDELLDRLRRMAGAQIARRASVEEGPEKTTAEQLRADINDVIAELCKEIRDLRAHAAVIDEAGNLNNAESLGDGIGVRFELAAKLAERLRLRWVVGRLRYDFGLEMVP